MGTQRPWSLATCCILKSYDYAEQVADGLGCFSYPVAHCELDHPKLVSHRWDLDGDTAQSDGHLPNKMYSCNIVRGEWRQDGGFPVVVVSHLKIPVDSGKSSYMSKNSPKAVLLLQGN
ncbi:hypothetical protein llap_43 [Limosa lapponica baueri]|uniref:Uncharacterized protein n=1 Tax=Limosa lapponica baueri TaxID=1758121 RepID=A0A2I0UUE2_LIMLA|nr:hypothetical protein llap_43 [Limosa lapponica baueri]